jgi:hypothetical protein
MVPERHNPEEPVFRLEEPDRRTKIGRWLMVLIAAFLVLFTWYSSTS